MTTTRPGRTGTALSWVVYTGQVLASAVLALLAITSVFMTDSCGSVADEPAVCNTGYFGAVLIGYWVGLAVLLVLVPIGIVRASRRGRSPLLRALAGIVLAGIGTVLFVILMTR
ncbi:MAG: hypothetical protein JWR27_1735 [Aeromicrobium sp.]|jgi:hypothetical protein|nr:hypothetical protein [Aeromicrobium sp.]